MDNQAVVALGDELRREFEEENVDYVPDPMVLRTAELFLLGRKGCLEELDGFSESEAWALIDKNLDGLLAFFHVLMTRERIPLIDYGATFPGGTLINELNELAVDLHPTALYEALVEEGFKKVEQMDLNSIDPAMAADVVNELGTAGYEWYPKQNQFEDLIRGDDKSQQVLATFVLGGLVFGGYAQATGSDHLLQTKRARLFTQLAVPQDPSVLWGFTQEQRLYERLRTVAETHEGLSHADFTLPPSVVPLLIEREAPKTPKALFESAVVLRNGPVGGAYREWHTALRSAWSQGRRDTEAEAAVSEVAKEVERRLGLDETVLTSPKATLSAGVGVNLGIVQLGAAVDHDVDVAVPARLRNWLFDSFRFRDHRKMLLRMSIEQATFDNLSLGLRNMWRRGD